MLRQRKWTWTGKSSGSTFRLVMQASRRLSAEPFKAKCQNRATVISKIFSAA